MLQLKRQGPASEELIITGQSAFKLRPSPHRESTPAAASGYPTPATRCHFHPSHSGPAAAIGAVATRKLGPDEGYAVLGVFRRNRDFVEVRELTSVTSSAMQQCGTLPAFTFLSCYISYDLCLPCRRQRLKVKFNWLIPNDPLYR